MADFEDVGDISKFNPAQHKMNRINDISRTINGTMLGMKIYNYELNDWNFNLYFLAIKRLYAEVSTKFSEAEKEECEKMRWVIENNLKKYPIVIRIGKNKWTPINTESLEIFIKWMERYEQKVREYQDKHGLDTPNQEDESGE